MPADSYLGEITPFAGGYAAHGSALCNGSLMPIQQNTALFSLLGTNFGGDGRRTFALPDLRGALITGPGDNGLGSTSEVTGGDQIPAVPVTMLIATTGYFPPRGD